MLQTDLLNNGSSDDEDLLPPSLQSKGKGRSKKTKPDAKKEDTLPKAVSPPKKAKDSHEQTDENSLQQAGREQATHIDDLPSASRRRTRSSAAGTSQVTPSSIPTENNASARGSARGRRGRRGANRGAMNRSAVENAMTMSLADSLGVFAAMMSGRARRNVMRAQRAYFAEIAARSTNVDYVDLVSSPLPRIEGVVTVDSDGEESKSSNSIEITGIETPNTSIATTLECSFDEDNPETSVKIKWDGGNPEIFQLRKHQKFQSIFTEIANRENTPIDNIIFNIDNRIISPSDTPASINYKVYEFISGRVLTDLFDVGTVRKKRDANIITLKIQSDLWPKKPLKVELNKTDKLKILYIKCAEELKMPAEDLVLSFNGDHLGFNETPEDFEFEGDEAIDLRVKKK
ncbi:uncharacterized protein CG4449 [Rhagoletis pomonella]|uniref:uncharacterized protein CG4449 n=1 Tax=Rhagoletis pomonella TaxID=28610 RepID=UPI00177ED5E5|nr:uncharacterized protein CG4449 [Rhagoletis pomonella]